MTFALCKFNAIISSTLVLLQFLEYFRLDSFLISFSDKINTIVTAECDSSQTETEKKHMKSETYTSTTANASSHELSARQFLSKVEDTICITSIVSASVGE